MSSTRAAQLPKSIIKPRAMLRLRSLVLRSATGPRGGLALSGWRANSTTATNPAAAAATTTGAADVKEEEQVTIDLSTVGAETTEMLTIADVLSTRDAELANGPAAAVEEWESIHGSQSIHDAIALMVKANMGSLIVTEEKDGIVGIVTERDILKKTKPRSVYADPTLVKDIMSAQIMCVHPSTTVIDALATMTKENIRHLAVIHGDLKDAGKKGSVPEEAMRCVLSVKDIIKAYSRFEAEKKLQQAPAAAPTPAVEAPAAAAIPAASTDEATAVPAAEAVPATPAPPATPVVTAATLLKKKHKKTKLILNTRVEDNISVAEAVEEMAKNNFGAVLVVDKDQRVLGIFTERDYLTKVLINKEDPVQLRMVDVATKEVSCLQFEDTLEKCWNHAATQRFRHFPVIGVMRKDREKELAGILSIKDIVREISKDHHTEPAGFRLMDFFKPKPKPEPVAPPAPAAPAAPVGEASTPAPEATPAATGVAEPKATPVAAPAPAPSAPVA